MNSCLKRLPKRLALGFILGLAAIGAWGATSVVYSGMTIDGSTLSLGASNNIGINLTNANTWTGEQDINVPSGRICNFAIGGTEKLNCDLNGLVQSRNGGAFSASMQNANQTGFDTNGQIHSPGFFSTGTKFTTTGCSVSATTGGGSAGKYTSGTTGTCAVVITMNGATGQTAANGWDCHATDLTTAVDATSTVQTASSTTTATLSGTTVSGDVISFSCMGY